MLEVADYIACLRAGTDQQRKGWMMDARIDDITLAVVDLDRALAFYRDGLGLQTQG
jgi:catechol-2,3-dioxygenase